ncbi:hypothetical protein T4D_14327 [Trichinella pseudospiralis]|uniref:Uncharacterized protein n=1 Tax=Trichinella pseudospiralis TaxID=6337 RepID=A0A0V1F9D6_TRIPS|nr:hypothetical protein T4D_14327 [Trichinella pseudospiralis]
MQDVVNYQHHMMYYCSSVIGLGSRWSALQMAFFDACLSMCLCVAFSAIFSLARVDQIMLLAVWVSVCFYRVD